MADKIRAALMQNAQAQLKPVLQEQLRSHGVEVCLATTCAEARSLMASANPPELVLTDLEFPDGTWEDVVRIYMEALQNGAFDFIAPPFEAPCLSHVLRTASANARFRRNTMQIQPHPGKGEETQLTFVTAS